MTQNAFALSQSELFKLHVQISELYMFPMLTIPHAKNKLCLKYILKTSGIDFLFLFFFSDKIN